MTQMVGSFITNGIRKTLSTQGDEDIDGQGSVMMHSKNKQPIPNVATNSKGK